MYTILKDPNIDRTVKIIKPNQSATIYPDGTRVEKDEQPINSIGIIKSVDRKGNQVLVELHNKTYTYCQWFYCEQLESVDGN